MYWWARCKCLYLFNCTCFLAACCIKYSVRRFRLLTGLLGLKFIAVLDSFWTLYEVVIIFFVTFLNFDKKFGTNRIGAFVFSRFLAHSKTFIREKLSDMHDQLCPAKKYTINYSAPRRRNPLLCTWDVRAHVHCIFCVIEPPNLHQIYANNPEM